MENNLKKDNSKSLIIMIILLVICVLGLSGYIVYDKVLSDNTKVNSNENNSYNQEEKLDINSPIAEELKSKVLNGFYDEEHLTKNNNKYEFSDVYKVHYAVAKLNKDKNYNEKEIDGSNTKIFSIENVEKVINDNFSDNGIIDYKLLNTNMGGGLGVHESYNDPYIRFISYNEQENNLQYTIKPTGGLGTKIYPMYQFDFINIEKEENNYYLTVNVLLFDEIQEDYRCAFDSPSSTYKLKVYDDFEKNNLIYEKELEVPCNEEFEEYIKNNISDSEYISKSTKYKFKFSSDKKLIHIEKF